jgi:hypothetical protein
MTDVEAMIQKYIAAWNEPDDDARKALLDAVWSHGAAYTDPQSHADNQAELDAIIAGFQAGNPGAKFTLKDPLDHHHHHVRFYWTLQLANGTIMQGMDYGEITPDGKLAKIVGFF